jgi:hypothetical protein
MGWSRRKLASKVGLTLREMAATEKDTMPSDRKEKRVWMAKMIPFLGYRRRLLFMWPIRDKKFDLTITQDRVLNFLQTVGEISRRSTTGRKV